MKIMTVRANDMPTACALSQLKRKAFPENFKFRFKWKQHHDQYDGLALQDLIRPRLKIAIVTETWSSEMNGRSIVQLCQNLRQLGHKVLLVRPVQQHICPDFHPEHECLISSSKYQYVNLASNLSQDFKLTQAFQNFAPDVVHIVTESALGFTALCVAKAQGIAISSSFYSPFQSVSRFFDLAFLTKSMQRYLMWFYNSSHVTCVPDHHAEQILRGLGLSCRLEVVGQDSQRLEQVFYQIVKESAMTSS